MQKKILISACLLGKQCRYNGKDSLLRPLNDLDVEWVPVCPEEEGGLGTPRQPAELQGNAGEIINGNAKILTIEGMDVTNEFITGAEKSLYVGLAEEINTAILKSRSPSCGSVEVYDGQFRGKLIKGKGIFAYLCSKNGIKVQSSDEFYQKKPVEITENSNRLDNGNS